MRKLMIAIAVVGMLCAGIGAKETKAPELTEEQKITQQIQVLSQRRQQYLQTVQQIEIELIKLQAVLQYITKDGTTEEKK